MPTDTSERSPERLICTALAGHYIHVVISYVYRVHLTGV